MAKIDQKKKNLILLAVMIILVGLTVIFLLRNQSNSDIKTIEDSVLLNEAPPLKIQSINRDVFTSPDFQRMQDYSDKKLNIDQRGRVNPFEPFQISIE